MSMEEVWWFQKYTESLFNPDYTKLKMPQKQNIYHDSSNHYKI